MKITESYLRKIIRGAINEMFTDADANATPVFHGSQPAQQEPTMSSSEIIDHILSAYQKGDQVDDSLLQMLKQIQGVLPMDYGTPETSSSQTSFHNFTGTNESRKRK